MIYDLSKNNPYDRDKFIAEVKKYLDKGIPVNLTKVRPPRSDRQNRYLHTLLSYFGSQYGITQEEAKLDYFKKMSNPELFFRMRVNKQGRQVQYLRSSTELTTAEMTTAIERFRNWSSAVAGIYLPSPDEHQFLLHCEKEIEANKEYL